MIKIAHRVPRQDFSNLDPSRFQEGSEFVIGEWYASNGDRTWELCIIEYVYSEGAD